jgi:peptide/nickel transport system substrate-binding protein
MNGSKSNYEEVAGYNTNGEISGDVIHTTKVDNLGYGYIGMNADTVLVGTDPASAESKALRKAIATVLAVYRDVAYDSYYGEAASVINYPISNTSWAAPQATDEGYKVAFSIDADGKDIYTSAMDADEKYAAALKAAVGYFVAAGFTYDEATGMLTAAPAGAKLSYEVAVGGDGIGDHPSFAVLTDAAAAFATIGFELKINDLTDTSVLWDMLDAGSQELWCAAWQATIDPDMYQIYHSSGIVGRGGSDSNHYHIDDATLDQLIVDARKSDDQAYRKAIYRQALDLVGEWAVEIPAYQRQNSTVFSASRVMIDSITPDITTFWGWLKEVEKVAMQ